MKRSDTKAPGDGVAMTRTKYASAAKILGAAIALSSLVAACGDDAPRASARGLAGGTAAPSSRPGASAAPSAAASAAAGDGGVADASRPPALVVNDNDFNESDRTRDPFRNFARDFVPVVRNQETIEETMIKLRQYGIDELRLVAVITGSANPYAMVVDSTGRGTIVRRGEYVGRPETIGGGTDGTVPHQAPWRLARIVAGRVRRDADNNLTEIPAEIVFEREDRLNPTAPRAERSLTLNPAAAAAVAAAAAENAGATPLPLPSAAGMGSPFLPTLPSIPAVPGQRPIAAPSGMYQYQTAPSAVPGQPGVTQQTFTTVIPPTQGSAAPTTIMVQTAPPAAPQVTPMAMPNTPPPVMINGSGSGPMPLSGLGR